VGEYTLVELVLSNQNLSSFYEDFDTFASIQESLSASFEVIDETRETTEGEKTALETRRSQELELRRLQDLERQKIQTAEDEKKRILSVTKGQEVAYQNLIKEKQKTAAQIRAELFSLRDSAAIPFGQALAFAEKAEAATGVRAALILGVLKQETNLGENTGTGTWTVDMHPTRDQPVFRFIADVLGFSPDALPVSKKPSYGWGGAMGPSQFIPSTWVCYGGFINSVTSDCSNSKRDLSWDDFWKGPWEYQAGKDRIRALVGGNDPSNPWANEDAFMATGLLMKENGAAGGSRSAERLAALRYFAGWGNAAKPAYAFYGDSVMEFADFFEQQIAILEGV
jgi:membrane-bound lytic murein transglycosylase B